MRMAEEDSQLPDSPTVSDDDKALAVSSLTKSEDGIAGSIATKAAAIKGGESPAKPKQWKREILSAQSKAESPLAPSELGTSSKDQSPLSKAAKRIKAREGARKANDLMECFRARAATTAETAGEMKKKPAASASTHRTKS